MLGITAEDVMQAGHLRIADDRAQFSQNHQAASGDDGLDQLDNHPLKRRKAVSIGIRLNTRRQAHRAQAEAGE